MYVTADLRCAHLVGTLLQLPVHCASSVQSFDQFRTLSLLSARSLLSVDCSRWNLFVRSSTGSVVLRETNDPAPWIDAGHGCTLINRLQWRLYTSVPSYPRRFPPQLLLLLPFVSLVCAPAREHTTGSRRFRVLSANDSRSSQFNIEPAFQRTVLMRSV